MKKVATEYVRNCVSLFTALFIGTLLSLFTVESYGQIDLTNASPSNLQNFNSMNATTTLPTNWKMHASTSSPNYASAATTVTQQASSGSPTAGGTYNWGSAANERAVGSMTSGSFGSPNNVLAFYRNNGSTNITGLTIAYDAERYRINSAAASIQFYYSLNGSSWTAISAGDIATTSFPTGGSSYTIASPLVVNKTGITINSLNIAPLSAFYLRWNINTTGSNSQGIGVDNVSVTATFVAPLSPCTTPTAGIVSDQDVIVPNTATFSLISATDYTSIQWQVNTGSSWSNIPSETGLTYTTSATTIAMNGYQYRAVLTNNPGGCTSATNTSTAGTLSVTEVLSPPILQDAQLNGTVGVPFNYSIVNTGSPADTYTLHDGELPTGLSLNSATGHITGTPTSANGFIIEVIATNSEGNSISMIDFTIAKGTQILNSFTNQTRNIGEGSFDLTANTNAGLAVTYNSLNSGIATTSGNTVTLGGLGTTTITATQAGNTNWNELNLQIELTVVDGPCGSESFTNIPFNTETGTGFSANLTRTWIGDNGIGWEATFARTDRTMTSQINAGDGPEERTIAMSSGGSLYNTIPVGGGIGVLSFEYARYFSTNSTITIFINDIQYGSDVTVDQTTSSTFTLPINITGPINLRIQNGTGTVVIDNLTWTCFSIGDPILSVSPTSLTNFTYAFDSGPSTVQVLTVSGQNLDGLQDLQILPGDNYEISFDQLTWFDYDTEPIARLNNYNGTETLVYVRLKAGLAVGTYNNVNDDLILFDGYDLSTEVILSGSVTCVQPSIPAGTISGVTPSCGNTAISFSGTALNGITYYWQNSSTGISTTNSANTSLDVSVSGTYFVRAKNNMDDCWSDATAGYAIVVNTPVSITSQPLSQVVITGNAASFNSPSTGTPTPTYLWEMNTGAGWIAATGTNNTAVYDTGVTNPTMDGYQYRCVVSNSCNSVTSSVVSLSVNAVPVSIWTNPITDSAPYNFNPFVLNQTVNTNITVSGIGRGTGISGNAATGRYNAAGWESTSLNTNDYFYFILTPNTGFEIDLSSIQYNGQASGSGPSNFAIRSSIDGFASNIGSASVSSTISLNTASFQNVTSPIEFRLYGWMASSSGGTFSVNDFTFSGSVNCIAPLSNVTNVSNTTSETSSISLTWPSVTDADGYVVVIRTTDNDFSEIIYTGLSNLPTVETAPWLDNNVVYVGGNNNAIIENLSPGDTYSFKVFAYNNCTSTYKFNSEGSTTNPATFTTNPGYTIDITSNTFGPFCNTNPILINVSFIPNGIFTSDFKVQLSDAFGNFPSNTNDNIIGTGSSSPINATIPALQLAAANYRIRVLNDNPATYGTSNSTPIIINAIPTITVQPIDQLTTPSSLAGFTVTNQAGEYFVWEEQIAGESTWSVINNGGMYSNANTAALSIINPSLTMSGNKYRCTVSNGCGSITSIEATLTVTIQPISIWANTITGSHPGGSASPYTQGQTHDLNITVSGIGKSGVLPSGTPSDNRYNTQGWDNAGVDLNRYIYFTLDANAGYEINFAALNINVQRSGTGPSSFVIRSSQNNYASNIGIGIYNASTTSHTIDLSSNGFQSIENPITFRIYAYSATGATGTFSINDFNFTGNIGIICNTPASLNVISSVNTAYLDWEAPGYLPLNGYYWEVRTFPQGVLKSSGNTLLTAANASGLIANTNYRLSVYSRCGGDFLSDVAQFDFITQNGIAPNNDNQAANNPMLSSPNYVYPNCFQIVGSTINSTPSSIFENSLTGEEGYNDVWYQFNSLSNGVSIAVQSQTIDAIIYLLDSNLNILETENATGPGGDEKLNYGNLTAEEIYYIAIAHNGGTESNGAFTLCVQNLRKPECTVAPSAGYSLCSVFKSSPTAATSTSYSFTDENNFTTSITSAQPIQLSTPNLDLRYGSEYNVGLTANYALNNGAGTSELIQITNQENCAIQITAQPLIEVKSNQRCINGAVLFRNSYLQATTSNNVLICGVTGYVVELTPVSNCGGDNPQNLETFTKTITNSAASISLSYAFNQIPLSNNSGIGFWSVRWKPRFGNLEGEYGEAHVISVNGTAPSSINIEPTEEMNAFINSNRISATIYPNPNNGEGININVKGIHSSSITVRITDGMGKEIFSDNYQTNDGALSTIANFNKTLAAGLYLIEFKIGNEIFNQKMMVVN